jgi:PPM family protein phosphatase
MRFSVTGSTDVGLKRTQNEDAFLILPEERLFCVADGMGGHACGEVAARIAVEQMAEFYRMTGRDDEVTWPFPFDLTRSYDENRLITGMKLANLRIFERAASDSRLSGMGTTLVCLWLGQERSGLVGHVGDSRAYLYRGGTLTQLTEDHSLLNDYIRAKKPTAEEIEAFPHKNVIVRALGMRDTVQVDLMQQPLQPGDVLLLCCDGLSGMVPKARMAELLRASQADLKRANQALIEAANEAGGADNITSVLVQVQG